MKIDWHTVYIEIVNTEHSKLLPLDTGKAVIIYGSCIKSHKQATDPNASISMNVPMVLKSQDWTKKKKKKPSQTLLDLSLKDLSLKEQKSAHLPQITRVQHHDGHRTNILGQENWQFQHCWRESDLHHMKQSLSMLINFLQINHARLPVIRHYPAPTPHQGNDQEDEFQLVLNGK